jgi:hypothetical protein
MAGLEIGDSLDIGGADLGLVGDGLGTPGDSLELEGDGLELDGDGFEAIGNGLDVGDVLETGEDLDGEEGMGEFREELSFSRPRALSADDERDDGAGPTVTKRLVGSASRGLPAWKPSQGAPEIRDCEMDAGEWERRISAAGESESEVAEYIDAREGAGLDNSRLTSRCAAGSERSEDAPPSDTFPLRDGDTGGP